MRTNQPWCHQSWWKSCQIQRDHKSWWCHCSPGAHHLRFLWHTNRKQSPDQLSAKKDSTIANNTISMIRYYDEELLLFPSFSIDQRKTAHSSSGFKLSKETSSASLDVCNWESVRQFYATRDCDRNRGQLITYSNNAVQREHDLIGVELRRPSAIALFLLHIDSNHRLGFVEVQCGGRLGGWPHPQMHLHSAFTFPVRHLSDEAAALIFLTLYRLCNVQEKPRTRCGEEATDL